MIDAHSNAKPNATDEDLSLWADRSKLLAEADAGAMGKIDLAAAELPPPKRNPRVLPQQDAKFTKAVIKAKAAPKGKAKAAAAGFLAKAASKAKAAASKSKAKACPKRRSAAEDSTTSRSRKAQKAENTDPKFASLSSMLLRGSVKPKSS